jgi:hypothetical protein
VGTLPNEPIGGAIGLAQYENWKANFGSTSTAINSPQGSRVPEPSCLFLLALSLSAFFARSSPAIRIYQ